MDKFTVLGHAWPQEFEKSREEVKDKLKEGHNRKAYAKAQKATSVGQERDCGQFFILQNQCCCDFVHEDFENHDIFLGISKDVLFQSLFQSSIQYI